ncbi:MAG: flavodoxin domain-containing protein [Candidatus Faecousia sp.]|nr:flavodoxin domain-containing protein [Candidatus Faecousia sp.]
MRILVTYASKYGTTKRYAQWIAEDLACDLRDSREVNAELLKSYDILIHGGGLYAGGLSGIQTIVKNYDAISNKRIILFSCGLADPEDPENVAHIEAGLEKVLTPEMREKIRQFHLRGGIDYSRLGLTHKAMMAMLRTVMLKKGYDNLRSEDQMMLDTYGGTVDFSNRESLAPLLSYVRSLS